MAAGITKTCYHMYHDMATGIAPEFVNFNNRNMHAGARYNIQRPEAIEAIFYMYRKTGDPMYREWAWEMFRSMAGGRRPFVLLLSSPFVLLHSDAPLIPSIMRAPDVKRRSPSLSYAYRYTRSVRSYVSSDWPLETRDE